MISTFLSPVPQNKQCTTQYRKQCYAQVILHCTDFPPELFRRIDAVLFIRTWHSSKRILYINIFHLQINTQTQPKAVSKEDKNKIKLKGLFIRLKKK